MTGRYDYFSDANITRLRKDLFNKLSTLNKKEAAAKLFGSRKKNGVTVMSVDLKKGDLRVTSVDIKNDAIYDDEEKEAVTIVSDGKEEPFTVSSDDQVEEEAVAMMSDDEENVAVPMIFDDEEKEAFIMMSGNETLAMMYDDPLLIKEKEDKEDIDIAFKKNKSRRGSHPGRRLKKRSEIWKHFKEADGKSTCAQCAYCKNNLSYSAGSLSNLLRHLRKKHPTVAASINYVKKRTIVKNDLSQVPHLEESSPAVRTTVAGENSPDIEPVTVVVRTEDSKNKPVKNSINHQKLDVPNHKVIERSFRKDHSYGERTEPGVEELFCRFLQAELNSFRNELLRRKCRNEILDVLSKHLELV